MREYIRLSVCMIEQVWKFKKLQGGQGTLQEGEATQDAAADAPATPPASKQTEANGKSWFGRGSR
jgi:hypothetical protein